MTKNIFLVAVLMGLMLATASAALTFTDAATSYCPANADTALAINEQDTSGFTTFDQVGTYYSSGESVPLLVKKAASADDFKFFIYNDDLSITETKSRSCALTATHTKVGLFGSILITSLSSDLYACKYDSSATGDITIQKLLPKGANQPKPYYADDNKIFAIYNDGTNSKVCNYTVTGTADLTCVDVDGRLSLTTSPIASGNQKYILFSGDSQFYKYGLSNWAVDSTALPVSGTQSVKVFTLRGNNLVVDVLETANLKQTKLYKVEAITAAEIPSTTISSSTDIKYFTDGYSNFMQINSDQLVWVTVNEAGSAVFSTIIPKDRFVGSVTSGILNVGLSKAKAVVLYDTKVEYWRHTSTDNVQKYLQKSFATGTIAQPATAGAIKQFKLALSCICKGIDRMACFSATLNCVILRKAGGNCVKSDFAGLY